MKLTVAFPAYNEEATIGKTLIDAVRDLGALGLSSETEILVIDNASRDRTAAIVDEFARAHPSVRCLRHPSNLGYAGSNLTAFREAKGDVVVVADGDGQVSLLDLPLFLAQIEAGRKIVYGWRRVRHDPAVRIAVSFGLNILSRLMLGWPWHDINCGYRAVTRDVAREVRTARPVNYFGPELWAVARLRGWTVGEVEIRHFAREGGEGLHSAFRLPRAMMTAFGYLLDLRRSLRK